MTSSPAFLSFCLLLASIGLPIKHQPDAAGQAVTKAGALLAKSKYQEALDALEEAARLDPGNYHAYLNRVAAHEGLNQPDKVEEDYALAIRAAPRSPEPWSRRGQARTMAGHVAEALPDLDAAVGLDPYNNDLYYWRGCAHVGLGHNELAVADFTRGLELSAKHDWMVVNCCMNRCTAYRNLKRYEEALADNERSSQEGYVDEESKLDCLTHLKRYKEALTLYDKLLAPKDDDAAPDPQRPELLRQRAKTKIAMRDFPGAEQDLAEATKLKPPTTDFDGGLAWDYVLARRPEEALDAARRAIANGDAGGWIYINLADACLLSGKFVEARDLYLQYVDKWTHTNKPGLQAIKEDFADMREAGIDLPEMKSIEALLPVQVHLPPMATPAPDRKPVPMEMRAYGKRVPGD